MSGEVKSVLIVGGIVLGLLIAEHFIGWWALLFCALLGISVFILGMGGSSRDSG